MNEMTLQFESIFIEHDFFDTGKGGNIPPQKIIQTFSAYFDYICIFDEDFDFLCVSDSCTKNFKDHSLSKEFLLSKNLFDFANDFRHYYYNEFENKFVDDQMYIFKDYCLDTPFNKEAIYIKFYLARFGHYIVCFVSDLQSKLISIDKIKQQIHQLINENEQLIYRNIQLENELKALKHQLSGYKSEIAALCSNNIDILMFPMIELLKNTDLNQRQKDILSTLETNLNTISNPLYKNLINEKNCQLTSREIEVMNLILQGSTTKEIGNLLCLSVKTVEFHRTNIRKKLKITNKNDSLRDYLLSLNYENRQVY